MAHTKKQQHTGSKAVDSRCRNHGTCRCRTDKKSRARKEFMADVDFREQLFCTWCGGTREVEQGGTTMPCPECP